ncbi:class I SAM-dependent methyltransferase [Lentibacillus cibarius]|uniref:Class I SAM-dependent methyltransferase n=1 Tax=Lentibacillus cibarius TaxID=2583219 RepID=A0A549YGZ3_9BACI|nr:class I SAM-dependent methyltransferase [Lentibacillus cibarius]TRM11160.1 class I SAM-dependent methyltransferase [Lentibacillus cibarius]
MADHYFSHNPQSKSSPKKWNYLLRGKNYTFTSDHGVFSRNEVDYGSKLLLEHFEEPDIAGDFLDLGCGYGPIGIAVADSFRDRHVVMSDVNERAITLARKNAACNHIENVEIVLSDRLGNLSNRQFASILINPPIRAGKKVVHQMFEDSRNALLQHGRLWVVIQKKQGASSAMQRLEDLFEGVKVATRSKGYYVLVATNG